jgi:hypothetical protein
LLTQSSSAALKVLQYYIVTCVNLKGRYLSIWYLVSDV